MLDAKLAGDILAAVDANFDCQVAFTQDLVRFPSLRGQEHTAQDFMHDAIRCAASPWTAGPSIDAIEATPASRRSR